MLVCPAHRRREVADAAAFVARVLRTVDGE
jgi:hypothetical protein